MESLGKSALWWIISAIVELVAALIVAVLLLIIFNFSGIPALAALGYWNLYWLQMAVYTSVGGAVVIGNAASVYFAD